VSTVDTASPNPTQLTEAVKAAIEEQLNRMLQNRHFSHSRRFPTFLRFVVQETLAGNADEMKERTLGIEIFGRAADYDTSSDPIVRVTAAEIRKRIAQYYQEPDHERELRISLQAGSYVPQFHWPQGVHSQNVALPVADVLAEVHTELPAAAKLASSPARPRRQWVVLTALLLLLAAGGPFYAWRSAHRSALDAFWQPIFSSSDPVLFCMADQKTSVVTLRDAIDPTKILVINDSVGVVVTDDLNPLVKVAGILQEHGKRFSIRGSDSTNLVDLRNGPTVFVGAFDNPWTLRQTKQLRFHFGNNPALNQMWIADTNSTKPAEWVMDSPKLESFNNYRDYAIVARFTDPTTGRLSVIAAGVGRGGTAAAGDFLTDPDALALVVRAGNLAGNRGKQNIEVVLSTQIIDGQPGTPKIEAIYFW
jgi:hypothetical protein